MRLLIALTFLLVANYTIAQKENFKLSANIGTSVLLNAQTAKNPGIGFGLQYSKIQSRKIINWLGIHYTVLQKRPYEEIYILPFYYPKTYYTPKNFFIFIGKKKAITKSINIGFAPSFGYYTGSETYGNFAFFGPGDPVFKNQNRAIKNYCIGILSQLEIAFSKNSSLSLHINPQFKLFVDDRKNYSIMQTIPNTSISNIGINYIHSFHFK